MEIRVLSAKEMSRALDMGELIEGMKLAFQQLSSDRAIMPLRTRINLPEQKAVFLAMPAALPDQKKLAVKMVSVFGKNPEIGLPLIHALVTVFDAETGTPAALMDGEVLTAKRTGAGSGAATDLLARRDSSEAAILVSGTQAKTQLEAICCVRDIKKARVFSLHYEHAQRFVDEMKEGDRIPESLEAVKTPETAVSGADIICAATTSTKPVFQFRDLKPGVHVNGVGSFQPSMQEIDSETVKNALVYVDSRESALSETGDLAMPIQEGIINADHIRAELGEVVENPTLGRTTPEEITFFKSCGVAVQDVIAAGMALEKAKQHKLGQIIEL
ncbi:MAG: ornithine cyclodeaminase family protein [SAR324 cluster bacterium]|nr:ornithine cyclodeaminase family protein [SAR324 cluster bacterium]